jgi:hypothetical protein
MSVPHQIWKRRHAPRSYCPTGSHCILLRPDQIYIGCYKCGLCARIGGFVIDMCGSAPYLEEDRSSPATHCVPSSKILTAAADSQVLIRLFWLADSSSLSEILLHQPTCVSFRVSRPTRFGPRRFCCTLLSRQSTVFDHWCDHKEVVR